jgi:hypothetical protein
MNPLRRAPAALSSFSPETVRAPGFVIWSISTRCSVRLNDGERGVSESVWLIRTWFEDLEGRHDMVDVGRSRRSRHWPSRIGLLVLGYSAQTTALPAVDEARPEPDLSAASASRPQPFRQEHPAAPSSTFTGDLAQLFPKLRVVRLGFLCSTSRDRRPCPAMWGRCHLVFARLGRNRLLKHLRPRLDSGRARGVRLDEMCCRRISVLENFQGERRSAEGFTYRCRLGPTRRGGRLGPQTGPSRPAAQADQAEQHDQPEGPQDEAPKIGQ